MYLIQYFEASLLLLCSTSVMSDDYIKYVKERYPAEKLTFTLKSRNSETVRINEIYSCLLKEDWTSCLDEALKNIENKQNGNSHKKSSASRISQDYVDLSDLRSLKEDPQSDKIYLLNLSPSQYDKVKKTRRNDQDFVNTKILRTANFDSDIDESTEDESPPKKHKYESSDSDEYEVLVPKKYNTKYKNNVISNVKKPPKFLYMQGPSRLISGRRRIPQFLPKRNKWNTDDFANLKNFWINGPRH